MYLLYVMKSVMEKYNRIEIKEAPAYMKNLTYKATPERYNENVYACSNREELVKLGRKIQKQWIEELELRIENIKANMLK